MKTTMSNILGYTRFYNLTKDAKLPIKVAYKLSKLSSAIEQEQIFYQEKYHAIINEYAEHDSDGELINNNDVPTFTGNNEQLCYQAVVELLAIEVELPDINLTIDDLDCLEITPTEMNDIIPFLTNTNDHCS